MVGFVLARSSVGFSSFSGDSAKYSVDANILMVTIVNRFNRDDLSSLKSLVPKDSPMPTIGPISGDISMAPMMTGMELTLSPTDAMMMANAKMYTFGPLNVCPLLMDSTAASGSMCSLSWIRLLRRSNVLFFFCLILSSKFILISC